MKTGFTEVKHITPLLSLANAFSSEEMEEFDRRVHEGLPKDAVVEYVVEPKIDGLACSIIYETVGLSGLLPGVMGSPAKT